MLALVKQLEWSGWARQIRDALARIRESEQGLFRLAAGGTAVGTGLNAPVNFSCDVAAKTAGLTGYPFITAPNKFTALGCLDAMVASMAAVRGLAVALMKVGNDIRWLASGPRCGLGELLLPENEPGSSIMAGKVNPTQQEDLVMACIQVIGEDRAVAFAGSQGSFQLITMRPIIIVFLHHFTGALDERDQGVESTAPQAHWRRTPQEEPGERGLSDSLSIPRRITVGKDDPPPEQASIDRIGAGSKQDKGDCDTHVNDGLEGGRSP